MMTKAHFVIAVISVGAWLIGLGFGILFGVRLPQHSGRRGEETSLVVVGAFAVGVVLFIGALTLQAMH
jgi:hypothetical protein